VKKRRRLRRTPEQSLDRTIVIIRGHTVMLDVDLAALYGVSTKALNQAVKRNARRFPVDFRMQLTASERDEVVTNCDHLRSLKFSPALPWAFTEHGALMAASVLNSPRAVRMSIFVIRAFIRLRDVGRRHVQLAAQLEDLELRVADHDEELATIFAALRKLIEAPRTKRRRIGFALVTIPAAIEGLTGPLQRIDQRVSTTGRSMKLARPGAR
jgi:hypothetical protein